MRKIFCILSVFIFCCLQAEAQWIKPIQIQSAPDSLECAVIKSEDGNPPEWVEFCQSGATLIGNILTITNTDCSEDVFSLQTFIDNSNTQITSVTQVGNSLCFQVTDIINSSQVTEFCIDNVFFGCDDLAACQIIQDIIQDITDIQIDIANINFQNIGDTTIIYTDDGGVDIEVNICEGVASCSIIQNIITDITNIETEISNIDVVNQGDTTIVFTLPDDTEVIVDICNGIASCEVIQTIQDTLAQHTTIIYDYETIIEGDTTFIINLPTLDPLEIDICGAVVNCQIIQDIQGDIVNINTEIANIDISVIGGDTLIFTNPNGTVDTFPIQHPVSDAPVFACENDFADGIATQSTNGIEEVIVDTYVFAVNLNGTICNFTVRDSAYRINEAFLEDFIENYYNTDLCCPNDSTLTIQNENGLDTAKVWLTYECGTPCVAKYDTIYFGDFGMQYSLLGVMAGGSATQIFQNQYGEGAVHIWQTTNCITQRGPTILTPNATFTLSLDLDCVADSLASRICCPSDSLVEIPSGIGYEVLSYGCYPDCELSRDTILFPQVPISTITSTPPDVNGIATFTVTNTKPDGSNAPCGEAARIEFWVEIGGTLTHYETVEGLTGGTAGSATSTLHGSYTESILNHIPATDVIFDCSGGTIFVFDSEEFTTILSAQFDIVDLVNIRAYSYVGGSDECPFESVNQDNFTEFCQAVMYEIESVEGVDFVDVAISSTHPEIFAGDSAFQKIIIKYVNGVQVLIESDLNCLFPVNGAWLTAGNTSNLVQTASSCHRLNNSTRLTFALDKTYPCLALQVFDIDDLAGESVTNISPAAFDYEDIANANGLDFTTNVFGQITDINPQLGASNASVWLYFDNVDEVSFNWNRITGRAIFGELKSCGCE